MKIHDLFEHKIWIGEQAATSEQIRMHTRSEVETNDLAECAQKRELAMDAALAARTVIVLDAIDDRCKVARLDGRDVAMHALAQGFLRSRSPGLRREPFGARLECLFTKTDVNAAVATQMKIDAVASFVSAKQLWIESEIEDVCIRVMRH